MCLSEFAIMGTHQCLCVHVCTCSGQDAYCITGVDVKGTNLAGGRFTGSNQIDCRQRCAASSSCTFFVLAKNNTCVLRKDFVSGPTGSNNPDTTISVACPVRGNGR